MTYQFWENKKWRIAAIAAASGVLLLISIVVAVSLMKKDTPTPSENPGEDMKGAFLWQSEEEEGNTLPPKETPPADDPEEPEPPRDALLFEDNGDGTCTLVALGSHEGSTLDIPQKNATGLVVVALADGALENASSLTRISLPSTIKEIGTGAFVGCSALTEFSVDVANTKFCAVDGVLFSKDKTELLAYPAAREENSYRLSTNVHKIHAYAFDGISHLEAILYEGSTAAFQAITVQTGNGAFLELEVTCNYKLPSSEP